jgi:hypothetical protein
MGLGYLGRNEMQERVLSHLTSKRHQPPTWPDTKKRLKVSNISKLVAFAKLSILQTSMNFGHLFGLRSNIE